MHFLFTSLSCHYVTMYFDDLSKCARYLLQLKNKEQIIVLFNNLTTEQIK